MFKLDFAGQSFIIWTCPKWLGPDQNDLDPTKMIWTWPKQFVPVQNNFGPLEGQGIIESNSKDC